MTITHRNVALFLRHVRDFGGAHALGCRGMSGLQHKSTPY